MSTTLWKQHILPFALMLALLLSITLSIDYILHMLNLVWLGRYIGILGTLVILSSLIYSLKKRRWISMGTPKSMLAFHEFMAWLGALLILIHAGVHFNAPLPWIATVAMFVNVASGLVGKYLLAHSRLHIQCERTDLLAHGLTKEEVDQKLFWDSVMVNTMAKWRTVHIPIFIAFAVLSLGHIVSIFLFWSWK